MKYKITLHGDEIVMTQLPPGKPPVRAAGFLQFDSKTHADLYLVVQDGKILIWNEAKRLFAPKKGT